MTDTTPARPLRGLSGAPVGRSFGVPHTCYELFLNLPGRSSVCTGCEAARMAS